MFYFYPHKHKNTLTVLVEAASLTILCYYLSFELHFSKCQMSHLNKAKCRHTNLKF